MQPFTVAMRKLVHNGTIADPLKIGERRARPRRGAQASAAASTRTTPMARQTADIYRHQKAPIIRSFRCHSSGCRNQRCPHGPLTLRKRIARPDDRPPPSCSRQQRREHCHDSARDRYSASSSCADDRSRQGFAGLAQIGNGRRAKLPTLIRQRSNTRQKFLPKSWLT